MLCMCASTSCCCVPQAVAATILLLVCIMSASVRLFSVIKYESVIHEFDPYFNYRVTQFLTKVLPIACLCDVSHVDGTTLVSSNRATIRWTAHPVTSSLEATHCSI